MSQIEDQDRSKSRRRIVRQNASMNITVAASRPILTEIVHLKKRPNRQVDVTVESVQETKNHRLKRSRIVNDLRLARRHRRPPAPRRVRPLHLHRPRRPLHPAVRPAQLPIPPRQARIPRQSAQKNTNHHRDIPNTLIVISQVNRYSLFFFLTPSKLLN